jgi:hypothetical protein
MKIKEERVIIMSLFIGDFAENKDIARNIRNEMILPALEEKKIVILDFKNVNSATQSFIHALISEIIRKRGETVLEYIYFKNCNDVIKKIIEIVTDYMQDSF